MKHFKPILTLLAVGLLSMGTAGLVFGDDDGDERGEHRAHGGWMKSRADVAPVTNAVYGQECGSCHMAYQPGLLPADAWVRIMDQPALTSHYGDDATLADGLRNEITTYLTANAADQSGQPRSHAFTVGSSANSGQGDALPRITQTRYFARKHDEIPDRLVTANPKVGSFSQCNSCHRGAQDGVFNEHQINIPGYGPWED
jgi:hypothetical protein